MVTYIKDKVKNYFFNTFMLNYLPFTVDANLGAVIACNSNSCLSDRTS